MNIYKKTFNFLKKIYPNVKQDYEVRLEESVVDFDNYGYPICEYHPVPDYETMANIPFDIRSIGGNDIYIDGYIFYDFRKVKRYINKIIKGNKNGK